MASLPKPLLRSRYTLERVSSEFLVIASHERGIPLSTREIPRLQIQELAASLQCCAVDFLDRCCCELCHLLAV